MSRSEFEGLVWWERELLFDMGWQFLNRDSEDGGESQRIEDIILSEG